MRAYGIPRYANAEWPDLADIYLYGRKSSISRLPSKNGERKNSFRSSFAKRITRRIWKRKARAEGKAEINNYLDLFGQVE